MPPLSPKIERRRLPAAPQQVVWKGRGWRGSKLKCKAPLILRLLPIHAICIAKPALHSLHLTRSKCYICFNTAYASTLHMLHPIHLHLQQVVVQHYILYKSTSTTKLHLHQGACSRMWWCKQRGPRLHPRKQGLFSYSVKPWKYWKKNCSFSLFPEHSSNGMKLNWVSKSRETCFQHTLVFVNNKFWITWGRNLMSTTGGAVLHIGW